MIIWKSTCGESWQDTIENCWEVSGKPGPSSFLSRRAHLLTTCKAGGGIPPVGRARALLTNCLSDSSPEGAGNVASEHSLCSRLYILRYQQNDEVAYCHPIPPPACENLPPVAFTQLWVSHFRRHPFSLFKRETERKDGENKWQSIIWKQK